MSGFSQHVKPRFEVTSLQLAQDILNAAMSASQALGDVLHHETMLMKAGKVRQALELEPQKEAATKVYMVTMEHVKANLLALKRFSAQLLLKFKEAEIRFQNIIQENQVVIATTKAVTEGLIRSLALETQSKTQLTGYNQSRTNVKSSTNTTGFFLEKHA